jgi:DNA modification methylase
MSDLSAERYSGKGKDDVLDAVMSDRAPQLTLIQAPNLADTATATPLRRARPHVAQRDPARHNPRLPNMVPVQPRTPDHLPNEVSVKRSDPIYNAHAYLTKVPVTAIAPFIHAMTEPGDVVLDMYGGSGMTGVAAAILGRRAEVRDISELGCHIGTNYVRLVDPSEYRRAANKVTTRAKKRIDDVYAVICGACGETGSLCRTIWSYIYECRACMGPINYYRAFEAAGWRKSVMKCPTCEALFATRGSRRLDEVPVLDTISCRCSPRLMDQSHEPPINRASLEELTYPDVAIGADRQMFQASALARHGLLTTASFFSERNLAVLAALRQEIEAVANDEIRSKLLFAFTAVLSRASKRYQWHPKRPLNAANQNYYIAPVFYEWNVYELFDRKVEATLRSDRHIRAEMASAGVVGSPHVNYTVGSADALDLADESIDYVFTDPPFGSNIFYSDMNLFQEAWLGIHTDHEHEAVVDRSSNGKTKRTAERYERLITDSLKEAHRVLKPGCWLSLVFSNSSGTMWGLVQRAIQAAGFKLEHVAILNKGQRSVKGLASGFENVVTVDLILSMRKSEDIANQPVQAAPEGALDLAVQRILESEAAPTPSHVYLGVIREHLRQGWDVSDLDIAGIGSALQRLGLDVDPRSGELAVLRDAP